MKKFILISSCLLVINVGCKKKACYECTTTVQITDNSPYTPEQPVGRTTNKMCDKTASEIAAYEQAGTSTTTATVGSVTVRTVSNTKCNRQ